MTPDTMKTAVRLVNKTIKHRFITLLSVALIGCSPSLLLAKEALTPTIKNNPDDTAIRVAMSSAFVSDAGISIYNDIFSYLAKKLNRDVKFISGFSYVTINSMLESGLIDVGFICGLPYIIERDQSPPAIELLVAPIMKDIKYNSKPIYYSYIITHKDSKFNKFSDLKGSRFIYNDEISNSGYNMPRAHLIELGETSGFFSQVIRSGSHEESIRMVAIGEVDASAADSLVYDYDKVNNPRFISQTKIIKTLGPAGIPPVVISTKTSLPLRKKIREILLSMHKDPVGREIFNKALLERFEAVDDSNYDSIRQMQKQAMDAGYMVIH